MNKLDKKQKCAIKHRLIATFDKELTEKLEKLMKMDIYAGQTVKIRLEQGINIGDGVKSGDYLVFAVGGGV